MTRKVQLANDQLQQTQNVHREMKNKYSSNLRMIQNQIQTIRKEHLFIKDFYSKEIQNWKIYFQTIEATLQKGNCSNLFLTFRKFHSTEIQIIIHKYSKQTANYQQQLKYN